ncbi:MAG: hypothetical protein O3A85_10775 [Proteobacteria bacterium]|nr:hypothetical protein [Pseudomonadota bacterium]
MDILQFIEAAIPAIYILAPVALVFPGNKSRYGFVRLEFPPIHLWDRGALRRPWLIQYLAVSTAGGGGKISDVLIIGQQRVTEILRFTSLRNLWMAAPLIRIFLFFQVTTAADPRL